MWTDLGESDWSALDDRNRAVGPVGLDRPLDRTGRAQRGPHGERPGTYLRPHRPRHHRDRSGAALRHRPRDSTRRSSTARGSATSSWRPGSPATTRTSTSRPTTSPTCSVRRQPLGGGAQRRLVPGPHGIPPDRRQLRRDTWRSSVSSTSATRSFGTGEAGVRDRARSARPTSWPASPSTCGSTRAPGSRCGSSTTTSTRLTASPAPPTRRVEELRPVAVTRLVPDRQVVDLGQNINGWVRLHDLGPEGTDHHAHPRRGARRRRRRDPGPPRRSTSNGGALHVGQIDRVISAGGTGEVFEPRHTTHGFQYVRVEGHPGRLDARRRDRGRRPHRPPPHGLVPVQRRAGQPASTRSPTGASGTTPATSPPTARSGSGRGGPATTRSSSPRPRSSTTWPASR